MWPGELPHGPGLRRQQLHPVGVTAAAMLTSVPSSMPTHAPPVTPTSFLKGRNYSPFGQTQKASLGQLNTARPRGCNVAGLALEPVCLLRPRRADHGAAGPLRARGDALPPAASRSGAFAGAVRAMRPNEHGAASAAGRPCGTQVPTAGPSAGTQPRQPEAESQSGRLVRLARACATRDDARIRRKATSVPFDPEATAAASRCEGSTLTQETKLTEN